MPLLFQKILPSGRLLEKNLKKLAGLEKNLEAT